MGKFSIPGTFFAHEGSPTSASNLTWFLQQFLPDLPDSYRVINEWVERGYEKQNDILFFPWLFGSNYHEALSGDFWGCVGIIKEKIWCTRFIRALSFLICCIRTVLLRLISHCKRFVSLAGQRIPESGCRCFVMPATCLLKLSILNSQVVERLQCVRQ